MRAYGCSQAVGSPISDTRCCFTPAYSVFSPSFSWTFTLDSAVAGTAPPSSTLAFIHVHS